MGRQFDANPLPRRGEKPPFRGQSAANRLPVSRQDVAEILPNAAKSCHRSPSTILHNLLKKLEKNQRSRHSPA
jgi:hypothetical protein